MAVVFAKRPARSFHFKGPSLCENPVSNTVSSTTYQYTASDLGVNTETVTYNIPGQAAISRVLDRADRSLGRDKGWQLLNGATVENSASYSYGTTDGRVSAVSGLLSSVSPSSVFTYGYGPGSNPVQTPTDPAPQQGLTGCWRCGP